MHVCYVDEAGDTGELTSATAKIAPVFAIIGLAVPHPCLRALTTEFLNLKLRFFPSARSSSTTSHYLDAVLFEIKGGELRKTIASGNRDAQRHALGFLDKIVSLLTHHQVRLFGRIWIKPIGAKFDGRAVYTSSMQRICNDFQHLLRTTSSNGFVVADSRDKRQNSNVSHSIFTQKFQASGDRYSRILEMPTFGHSDNHVGLQIADLVCSALLFPMAVHAYCAGHVNSIHVRPGYYVMGQRYGSTLKALQFRYEDPETGLRRGGLVVSDGIRQKSGSWLFK